MSDSPLVSIKSLHKQFSQRRGFSATRESVYAVRGVNLAIHKGETLGIVGESGCGKSTLGRMTVGLLPPSSGDVFIKGQPLYDATAHSDYKAFRASLAGLVQMVFQDPYSSLNPRMRVGESIAEPLICAAKRHTAQNGTNNDGSAPVRELVETMLVRVGLDGTASRRYPHEFSGGQRQRIAIARALITNPEFVVCDEPTSSLDASVQSQVLNLLRDMQDALGLTYCFISHDLGVVRHMCDRVAVMYGGSVVEEGDAEQLFAQPGHPYTRLLFDSLPDVALQGKRSADVLTASTNAQSGTQTIHTGTPPGTLPGTQASHTSAPSGTKRTVSQGCAFAPRCPLASEICFSAFPELTESTECPGYKIGCHFASGRKH